MFSAEHSSCEVPLPTSLGPMYCGVLGGVAVGADLSVVGVAVVVGPLVGAKFGSFASADSSFVGAAMSRAGVKC